MKTRILNKIKKFQGPVFQIQEHIFAEVQEASSSDRYKSRNVLYTRYGQDKKSYSKKYLKLFPKVRDISDKKVSLIIVKDHVKNTLNLAVATYDRVLEMRLDLLKVPVPDKIHLHKHTGEVNYTDLLKATLKVSKLQTTISILENQLKREKIENKTYQQQIKKLQGDLVVMDSELDRGQATKKILAEKENTIQLLMKITSARLI